MVLTSLPAEWQNWVVDNLARECDPRELGEILMRGCHLDAATSLVAIEEARRLKSPLRALPMPDIDTRANRLRSLDRTINVLLTVSNPRLVLLDNVVSHEECDSLVALCAPNLTRSPVVDDEDGTAQSDQRRTSLGAMLQREQTPLVARIEARLAELAQWPIERAEGLQIQHYETTNEYQPHYDWFDPTLPGQRKQMDPGGQRLATFVLYLSDVEAGGGTSFPGLGLDVRPKKGSAVFFQNTNAQHEGDSRTLHAGSPVVRGVKTIANKWLREHTYAM